MLREFSCNRKELDKGGNYVFQGGKDGCSLSRIKIKRVPYPWNPPSFESSSALSQWRTASQKERLSYRVLFNYLGKELFHRVGEASRHWIKVRSRTSFHREQTTIFSFFFFLGKHLLQIRFFLKYKSILSFFIIIIVKYAKRNLFLYKIVFIQFIDHCLEL